MAIEFREVTFHPLENFSASAPKGAIVGIVGETDSGAAVLLQLAAGEAEPLAGGVAAQDVCLLDHPFARADALARAKAIVDLQRFRAQGATILLFSNETDLLSSLCDEVWWIESGRLAMRGD